MATHSDRNVRSPLVSTGLPATALGALFTPGGGSTPSHPGATGGIITTFGDYRIHAFIEDGDFTPLGDFNVDYLIVAGGGGGGSSAASQGGAGGGGAGGLQYLSSQAVTLAGGALSAVVGAGGAAGAGGSRAQGVTGSDSSFNGTTSSGGGGGAGDDDAGLNGGSGGGAGRLGGAAGTGIVGQGNAGGVGNVPNAQDGGAGGGAGAVGGTVVGDGGVGLDYSDEFGTAYGESGWFAGGGGGGNWAADTNGGVGGGGDGNGTGGTAGAGLANSGGGGGAIYGTTQSPGAGGKGIVLVRYKVSGDPDTWTANNTVLAAQDDYLKAYWKFEDLSDSIGSNTLTNVNAATFTAGKHNNAGTVAIVSQQYFTAAASADFAMGAGDFYQDIWLYRNNADESVYFFLEYNTGDLANFCFVTGGGFDVVWNTSFDGAAVALGGGVNGGAVANTTQTLLGFARVGNNWRTYNQGSPIANTTQAGTVWDSSSPMYFGQGANVPDRTWGGQMDEAGLWIGMTWASTAEADAFAAARWNGGTGAFLI